MKFSQLTQKCPLKLLFLLIQDLAIISWSSKKKKKKKKSNQWEDRLCIHKKFFSLLFSRSVTSDSSLLNNNEKIIHTHIHTHMTDLSFYHVLKKVLTCHLFSGQKWCHLSGKEVALLLVCQAKNPAVYKIHLSNKKCEV